MAKKRKLSTVQQESSTKTAEPEQLQPQSEEQQDPQIEQGDEQLQQEQIEEQQTNGGEGGGDEDQEQPQEMEEDNEEKEAEDGGEGEGDGEALNASTDAASKEQVATGENGGAEAGNGEEAEEEEDLEDEPVEKLLEPFSKEQLVLLVKEAVSKYPDLVESVQKLADADPAQRKIFVHGLGWDTNAETLTSVFGKYGEIEDCKAVCDKVSGKSKGYGFILFKHRSGARKALKEPQKKIGTRITSCQLASTGPVQGSSFQAPTPTAPPVSEYTQRKIFVSNVSADVDPQKLLEFFSKFGEVEEGPLGLDKQTGKPKGFALFVYKSVESAKRALEEPHKNYEGLTLHCQKAIDGPKPNKPYYQQQHQHQHQHQQPYHHHSSRKEKGKYSAGGGAGSGHLMAPSGPAVGYNPAVAAPAINPALGA